MLQTIKLIEQISKDGRLKLDIPTNLSDNTVEVVMVLNTLPKKEEPPPYDFTDVAGKLNWQGDAILEQRKLRDEW